MMRLPPLRKHRTTTIMIRIFIWLIRKMISVRQLEAITAAVVELSSIYVLNSLTPPLLAALQTTAQGKIKIPSWDVIKWIVTNGKKCTIWQSVMLEKASFRYRGVRLKSNLACWRCVYILLWWWGRMNTLCRDSRYNILSHSFYSHLALSNSWRLAKSFRSTGRWTWSFRGRLHKHFPRCLWFSCDSQNLRVLRIRIYWLLFTKYKVSKTKIILSETASPICSQGAWMGSPYGLLHCSSPASGDVIDFLLISSEQERSQWASGTTIVPAMGHGYVSESEQWIHRSQDCIVNTECASDVSCMSSWAKYLYMHKDVYQQRLFGRTYFIVMEVTA